MMKVRRDSISFAGRHAVPVPARFRYSEDGGRFWAHPATSPADNGDDISFCTNRNGEGLFIVDHVGTYHQRLGTTQFRAANMTQFQRKLGEFLRA